GDRAADAGEVAERGERLRSHDAPGADLELALAVQRVPEIVQPDAERAGVIRGPGDRIALTEEVDEHLLDRDALERELGEVHVDRLLQRHGRVRGEAAARHRAGDRPSGEARSLPRGVDLHVPERERALLRLGQAGRVWVTTRFI